MKELFAVTSLIVSIGANVPYIYEIIKGSARPERISWLLWTLLGGTYYFSALFDGGATYFTFGELIGPVTILVLSLKYGVGGKSRFDIVALVIAMIAFTLLFIVEGTLVSLLLALTVDAIGVLLTIRKLLIDPASESKAFWGLAAIASLLALLSLQTVTIETLLFPSYVLVVSIFIFIMTNPRKNIRVNKIENL